MSAKRYSSFKTIRIYCRKCGNEVETNTKAVKYCWFCSQEREEKSYVKGIMDQVTYLERKITQEQRKYKTLAIQDIRDIISAEGELTTDTACVDRSEFVNSIKYGTSSYYKAFTDRSKELELEEYAEDMDEIEYEEEKATQEVERKLEASLPRI